MVFVNYGLDDMLRFWDFERVEVVENIDPFVPIKMIDVKKEFSLYSFYPLVSTLADKLDMDFAVIYEGLGNSIRYSSGKDYSLPISILTYQSNHIPQKRSAISIIDSGDGFDYQNQIKLLKEGKQHNITSFGCGMPYFMAHDYLVSYELGGRQINILKEK